MKKLALLVIDVQNALIAERPLDQELVIDHIKQLIASARQNNVEVIYVQHCEEVGCDLAINTPAWEIYHEVSPNEGERIFLKYYNSAFRKTGLQEYLIEKGYKTLIITGMQTEYCIDTTCRVGFELGFELIIPEKTNTTYDNGLLTAEEIYEQFNYRMFHERFGTLEPLEATLARIQG